MGPIDVRSMDEFHSESLYTPEMELRKAQSSESQSLPNGSSSGNLPFSPGSFPVNSPSSCRKMIPKSVYRSIKTVVFSNKLNLLMPFGPLAIMVHNFTGHKVSFTCLCSLLYIGCWLGYVLVDFIEVVYRGGCSFSACWVLRLWQSG